MSRVLFAFELGGNYGHLVPAFGVIKELSDKGHTVHVAVTDLSLARKLAIEKYATLHQSPERKFIGHSNKTNTTHFTHNFSEVLMRAGWSDVHHLVSLVNDWHYLFNSNQIDRVIADFAPTAILAAHLKQIKYLSIGVGWTIPAKDNYLRFMKEHLDEDTVKIDYESKINSTLAQLTKYYTTNKFSLQELFQDKYLITTYPELDSSKCRIGCHVGPIVLNENIFKETATNWSTNNKKVFVYVRSRIHGFHHLLTALVKCDVEIICCIPDISSQEAQMLKNNNILVFTEPVNLPEDFLTQADLVISYGGQNLTNQALGLGIPLLCLSLHQESQITCQRVEELGVGIFLKDDRGYETILSSIRKLLEDNNYRERAKAFSDQYKNWLPELSISKVIERLNSL